MIGWDVWQVPLALLIAGFVLAGTSWLLLVEYRKAFFSDPMSVMSIEVLANILRLGGPGYIALLTLVCGLLMLVPAAFALIVLGGFSVYEILKAALVSLGLT